MTNSFIMERNLLKNEIDALDNQVAPLVPLLIDKDDKEINKKDTYYVSIDIKLNDKNSKCYYKVCVKWDETNKKKCKEKVNSRFVDDYPLKMTAIYAPDHYNPAEETILIIYLHGHLTGTPGLLIDKHKKLYSPSIKDYLNYSKSNYIDLRSIIKDSKKNIILVAPTLGPLSQYGNLASNFDAFMQQIIQSINTYIIKQPSTNINLNISKIILAAHSGGGAGMLAIASNSKSTYVNKIDSFWGFDSWYNSAKSWNDLISKNSNATVYAYKYDSQYAPDKIKNKVVVVASKLGHFELIPKYFKERINDL